MTQQSPFGGRGRGALPTLPKGETVATFETYAEAQSAVDVLARADFPVEAISILGNDLKSVERVTGKLTWGRVAIAGAASGAWMGVFFGLLLFIFAPSSPSGLGILLAAVLIGAGFGMMFGLVSYAINRRRRDFTSTMQVIASSYSILVAAELAMRAEGMLGGQGAPRPPVPPTEPSAPSEPVTPPPSEPPRYGERLPDGEQPPHDRPE